MYDKEKCRISSEPFCSRESVGAGLDNAIAWKILIRASRDPGIAIGGARQAGLRFFHVISKLIFGVFKGA